MDPCEFDSERESTDSGENASNTYTAIAVAAYTPSAARASAPPFIFEVYVCFYFRFTLLKHFVPIHISHNLEYVG
jgi:hypothetical protein